MARGGQYSNGGPPVGRPYNENYYKNGGLQGPPPPFGPPGPPPGYAKERIGSSRYPDKNNGTLVRGGRVGTLKVLAGGQLVVGLALLIMGCISYALGPINMSMALLTGSCMLWCPAGSVATGIVGLFLSRGNTRDFVCMRRSYQVMCLLNAVLFMVLLALTTGFVQLRSFDSDPDNISTNEKLLIGFLSTFTSGATAGGMETEKMGEGDIKGYMSLAAIIISFCALNEIFAILSIAIICCGAPFAIDQPAPLEPVPSSHSPPIERPVRQVVVERPVEDVYYSGARNPPGYLPRPRTPPAPRRRPTELAILPRRSRPSYYDDTDADYYRKYYKDYERMMSKFREARRNHGTIRSADFNHYFPRRHRRTRSFDEYSYGDHQYDRFDRRANDHYETRDIYSDY